MKVRSGIVAILAAVALVAGGGFFMSAQADAKVLFVGNSYTHVHDVPQLVAEISAATGTKLEVDMIAPGGRFLDEHASDPNVLDAIANGGYDIVVLQEQSIAPAHPEVFPTRTFPGARALSAKAKASGARVILFQTWARRNGSEIVGKDYEGLHSALVTAYDQLGESLEIEVSPVGENWHRATSEGITLYADDGSHASPAGAYLAAATLSRSILSTPLTHAPAEGISQSSADALVSIANSNL